MKPFRKYLRVVALAALCVLVSAGWWHAAGKPQPPGLSAAYPARPVPELYFYKDTTFVDDNATRHVRQEVFDRVIKLVGEADGFLLLDMFLFNDLQGAVPELTRPLTRDLTEALLAKRAASPQTRIIFITDPINTAYGAAWPDHLKQLQAAGVEVVITRHEPLRDSNPVYSSLWRSLFSWFDVPAEGGVFPHPFGAAQKVPLRSWLKLLNFKANHRKLLIVKTTGQDAAAWRALVASANPHDGSSAHGNAAVEFTGAAVFDLLKSERAVLAFSGGPDVDVPEYVVAVEGAPSILNAPEQASVSVVSERGIHEAVLRALARAKQGDTVRMSMFYLADRHVIEALKSARRRGADLRLVIDPNFDAFGRKKSGVPNRQSAQELHEAGAGVRFCYTHGEQCHGKVLLVDYADGTSTLISGSANFTRRNLHGLNLETDVVVSGPAETGAIAESRAWLAMMYGNAAGELYSAPFEQYRDPSRLRVLQYRVQEFTGMGTF